MFIWFWEPEWDEPKEPIQVDARCVYESAKCVTVVRKGGAAWDALCSAFGLSDTSVRSCEHLCPSSLPQNCFAWL